MYKVLFYLAILITFLNTSCTSNKARREYYQRVEHIAAVERYKKMHSPLVVIDAGHGGKDHGAISNIQPKVNEKDLNLTTALMLSNYLEKMGFRTHLTRTDDVFIPLKQRAEAANDVKPHLFISVHYNAAKNIKADGVEVYYYRSEKDSLRTKKSQQFAQLVHDHVITQTMAKSRGIKHGNFAVIRETTMPAILVEGGFVTNDTEVTKIRNPAYQRRLALAMAQGIKDYLNPRL